MLNNTSYQVVITPRATRDIKKLTSVMLDRIDKTILKLADCPHTSDTRKLMARDVAQYRIRTGDHRILYDVDESDKTVIILRVGHRREIYR